MSRGKIGILKIFVFVGVPEIKVLAEGLMKFRCYYQKTRTISSIEKLLQQILNKIRKSFVFEANSMKQTEKRKNQLDLCDYRLSFSSRTPRTKI